MSHARARTFAIERASAWASRGRPALLEVVFLQASGGPKEMPAEFKNLPNAELAHDAIRKEYERFIKDNPEAGDL